MPTWRASPPSFAPGRSAERLPERENVEDDEQQPSDQGDGHEGREQYARAHARGIMCQRSERYGFKRTFRPATPSGGPAVQLREAGELRAKVRLVDTGDQGLDRLFQRAAVAVMRHRPFAERAL